MIKVKGPRKPGAALPDSSADRRGNEFFLVADVNDRYPIKGEFL